MNLFFPILPAIGAIEGQMTRLKGVNTKLSEQEVIECARNDWTGQLLGCNGGWHFSVYNHAKLYKGIASQANRPYRGNTYSACNTAAPRVPGSALSNYYSLPANNEAQLKEYLYKVGPLYVTFSVTSDFFAYRSGVYTDARNQCNPIQYNNHAVLLVGYGQENGRDYWLLKNSWGEIKRNVSM